MNIKQSTLAAAVTAALAMGAAGQAAAEIYAGAGLEVEDLTITIVGGAGTGVTSFDFRTTTASDLNGVSGPGDIDTCNGTLLANDCGPAGAPLVLDSTQSLSGNTVPSSIGAVNSFSFHTPGGGQFGRSDNVISDAALVGDANTDIEGIAEAGLVTGTSAGATSTIRSTTGFTLTFTIGGGLGSFAMAFTADPDQYAELIDPTAIGGTSSSTLTTTFQLSGPGGTSVSWSPIGNGIAAADNECLDAPAGVVCTETADTQNLNRNVSAPFGNSDSLSFDPLADVFTAFGISITGLTAGTYSFTLAATQEVNVTRQVPEPGVLALLGIGLLGMGAAARRKVRA